MTSGLKNPLTLMSYVSPVMALATALLSLALDPWEEFQENEYFNNSRHITRSFLLMIFGGTLAFFMVRLHIPFKMHIYILLSYFSCHPLPMGEFNNFILVSYCLTCLKHAFVCLQSYLLTCSLSFFPTFVFLSSCRY